MAAVGGQQDHWSSRFGFLMASVGFAVGLGNIWRFPYLTGENGGAAFVVVYLVCAFTIGVPILMAELMIGRRGQASPPAAMANVAEQESATRLWGLAGGMNLLTAFVIQVFYCVVAGWVLSYLWKAILNGFAGVDAVTAEIVFNTTLADVFGMLFWTFLVLAITGYIIYRGVQDGIEKAVSVLMPTLLLLLVAMVIYNIFAGGFTQAVDYLFVFDFDKITKDVWLAAIGQAFFSVGVAMAGMMVFGSYLPKSISIAKSVLIVIFADTVVALLAGLAIFPAVFAYGLDAEGGPGLIFKTLPVAFAQMPGGHVVSVIFFLLLSVAAITSMVGLLEPLIAWAKEHKGMSRHRSALIITLITAFASVFTILSYSDNMTWTIFDRDFDALLEDFSSQILLPLGGLLIAIFGVWVVSKKSSQQELGIKIPMAYNIWLFAIRFVAPIAVIMIMWNGIIE
jgi:NSS family neurotransmitter:Na+ symporter